MIAKQSQSTTLIGQRREYPPAPPGASKEVEQWWATIVQSMRQQDEELSALRTAVNALTSAQTK